MSGCVCVFEPMDSFLFRYGTAAVKTIVPIYGHDCCFPQTEVLETVEKKGYVIPFIHHFMFSAKACKCVLPHFWLHVFEKIVW